MPTFPAAPPVCAPAVAVVVWLPLEPLPLPPVGEEPEPPVTTLVIVATPPPDREVVMSTTLLVAFVVVRRVRVGV